MVKSGSAEDFRGGTKRERVSQLAFSKTRQGALETLANVKLGLNYESA
jgi:hypothetical protein